MRVGLRDRAAVLAARRGHAGHRGRLPGRVDRHRRRRRGARHRSPRPADRMAGHARLRRRDDRAVERRRRTCSRPSTRRRDRRARDGCAAIPLLDGFRGRPPADVDALADLVVTLADAVVGTERGRGRAEPGARRPRRRDSRRRADDRRTNRPRSNHERRLPHRAHRRRRHADHRPAEGERHRRGDQRRDGQRVRRASRPIRRCAWSS